MRSQVINILGDVLFRARFLQCLMPMFGRSQRPRDSKIKVGGVQGLLQALPMRSERSSPFRPYVVKVDCAT